MNLENNFNPKKTSKLYELKEDFNLFKNLILKDNFPHVCMLSGDKGIGKSTLTNHLMHFYFDQKNYDRNKNCIIQKGEFYNQFISNVFPNIIYLSGSNYKAVRIDDIRSLINQIQKTSINKDKRFIILDDIELFNSNALNALLKLIEHPNKNNHFILINNKSKPVIDTIKSRTLEFKIILDSYSKNKIINSLVLDYNQDLIINKNLFNVSPGNFIKFNYILGMHEINIEENFLISFKKLLDIYKKDKDHIYRELLLFFTNYYFENLRSKGLYDKKIIFEKIFFFVKNINNFFL